MRPKFPIKVIVMIAAQEGITLDATIDYYENHHAPLITSIGGSFLADYRRTYLGEPDSKWFDPPWIALPFSVVTEFWFRSEDDYRDFHAALHERRHEIDADERKFIDQSKVWIFRADERCSELPR